MQSEIPPTMKLHKTNHVLVLERDRKTKRYESGLVDETETLSLHKDPRLATWAVSSQRIGMLMCSFNRQREARIYMEYMLLHAGPILSEIPTDPAEAYGYKREELREIHLKAKELAGR